MFEKFTRDDLTKLTSVSEGPCISIYVPGMPQKALLMEYETLVKKAAHLLGLSETNGNKKSLLTALYAFNPGEHLEKNNFGMAIFINRHWAGFYLSTQNLPSKVVVAESFHLKPLLQDLQGFSSYHILTLNTQEAVLLHCDSGIGNEIHTFLFHQGQHSNSIHWKHLDESETSQIPHLKSHLRGRGLDDNLCKKKNVRLFLRWIEAKISREPGYKHTPLFVFASENMFHAYKEISLHPNPVSFRTEPGRTSAPRMESLIHQAQLYVQKTRQKRLEASTRDMEGLSQQKRVIDDLIKISRAAMTGKVRTLYIQDNSEIWGELNRKNGHISFHEKQENAKDDDILDDIACEVIRHGGEVVVLGKDDMPSTSPAAAILSS